jgi:2-hydroxyglutarate dehydrogenase
MIRHKEERRGLVELLGFNSPGLTSSLAVGEYVAAMIGRDVYKKKTSIEGMAEGWE